MDLINFNRTNGSRGQTVTIDNGTAYKDFLLVEFENVPKPKGADPKPPREIKLQIDQVENVLTINGIAVTGFALHLLKEYLKQLK